MFQNHLSVGTRRHIVLHLLTQDILDIDVQEKKAHDNVWKKRGSLATRMNHVLREIETDVAAVIEGGSEPPKAAASVADSSFGIAKIVI